MVSKTNIKIKDRMGDEKYKDKQLEKLKKDKKKKFQETVDKYGLDYPNETSLTVFFYAQKKVSLLIELVKMLQYLKQIY